MDYFWQAFALWALTRALAGLGHSIVVGGIASSGKGKVTQYPLTWATVGVQLIINAIIVLMLAELLEVVYG